VFTFKAVTGSVACSNDVFGDPIPGPVKACYFANYGLDVGEGSMSTAPAAGVDVAYGANGGLQLRSRQRQLLLQFGNVRR
jgi:hypothetical protein